MYSSVINNNNYYNYIGRIALSPCVITELSNLTETQTWWFFLFFFFTMYKYTRKYERIL